MDKNNKAENPTNKPNPPKEDPLEKASLKQKKRNFRVLMGELWINFKEFISDISDIKEGLDEEGTKDSIRKNIAVRGSNVWLLMCAIMVASLGLNLNSAAVIIGAMLISPLMSPILGIGLAVGVNDRKMLNASLYNFFIAIGVSLLVSALYFALSPFGEATPEMLGRTKPHFLDVLVAFFGGVAGIVSGSRADKSNAIPGVAIATALLPPLCVAGYGIATGDLYIFLGSFYLFFINSVCIALATYLIVQLLGFHDHNYINPKEKKRAQGAIAVFVLILIIPSFFILSNVLQDVQKRRQAEKYVLLYNEGHRKVVEHEISYLADKKGRDTDTLIIEIGLMGERLSEDSIDVFKNKLPSFGLDKALVYIFQDEVSRHKIDELSSKIDNVSQYFQNIKVKDVKDKQIDFLQHELDSIQAMRFSLKNVKDEIRVLFPETKDIGYSIVPKSINDSTILQMPTLMVGWNNNYPRQRREEAEERLSNWVRLKFELDTIQVLTY